MIRIVRHDILPVPALSSSLHINTTLSPATTAATGSSYGERRIDGWTYTKMTVSPNAEREGTTRRVDPALLPSRDNGGRPNGHFHRRLHPGRL